jgi:hypothetical protein
MEGRTGVSVTPGDEVKASFDAALDLLKILHQTPAADEGFKAVYS